MGPLEEAQVNVGKAGDSQDVVSWLVEGQAHIYADSPLSRTTPVLAEGTHEARAPDRKEQPSIRRAGVKHTNPWSSSASPGEQASQESAP